MKETCKPISLDSAAHALSDVPKSLTPFGPGSLCRVLELMFWAVLFVLALSNDARGGAPPSPFALNATMTLSNESALVTFDFRVPPDHVLYAERLGFFDADNKSLRPVSIPEPELHLDAVSGQKKLVYTQPFSATLKIDPPFPQ